MEKYIIKQDRLNKALSRIDKQLNAFRTGERTDTENWNKYHDLRYRIESRLLQNYRDYLEYQFLTFGFYAI